MGGAMMAGWIKGTYPTVSASNLLIIDPRPGEAAQALIENGVRQDETLDHSHPDIRYVLLATKPQYFDDVATGIVPHLPKDCVVISVQAGISLARLHAAFPDQHCVRAMPNTPAAIGKGITGYVSDETLDVEQRAHVAELLSAAGEAVELEQESMIDMVTAISGSGPAYFFHMVEALTGAGVNLGMPEEYAARFAAQTLIGAGALLEQSGQTATELRVGVTSPNGTTQAALDVLMSDQGLPHILRDAVNAAYHRSQELGKDS